jgi:hypothetical protein
VKLFTWLESIFFSLFPEHDKASLLTVRTSIVSPLYLKGKLNYSELIPKLRPLKKLTVNEVFDLLDDDKSGTLTREEVVRTQIRIVNLGRRESIIFPFNQFVSSLKACQLFLLFILCCVSCFPLVSCILVSIH